MNKSMHGNESSISIIASNASATQLDTCTTLANLDLIDVFTRLSIGNKDYWGTINAPWLALYYIHFIIFFTLLLIVNCWCGLILWEKRQSLRKHASFVYLISTYCVWSFTSATYYVLLTVEVNSLSNRQLAITTKICELLSIASLMNGLLVTAVYQFYLFYNHSINKYVFCGINVPFLLTMFIIIFVLLLANGSILTAVIILTLVLVLIGAVGTTLFIINYTKLWFRLKEGQIHITSARKVLARSLLIRVLGYVYLVLLTFHLTSSLIKVDINDDCVENAQGKRSTWLGIQSILEVFELVLVLQCLVAHVPQRIERLFKGTIKQTRKVRLLGYKTHTRYQSKDAQICSLVQAKSEVVTEVTNKLTSDYLCNSFSAINETDTRKAEPQKLGNSNGCTVSPKQVECVSPVAYSALEYEHLSQACDIDYSDMRETGLLWQHSLDTINKSYNRPHDFSTIVVDFNSEPCVINTLVSMPQGMSIVLLCNLNSVGIIC